MDDQRESNQALDRLIDEKVQEKGIAHPQEEIIESFDYKGVAVDIVHWTETTWCGKIGYAADATGEPDVDAIMRDFQALIGGAVVTDRLEDSWDVCLSANYLSEERPNGVMFGFLVAAGREPSGFDIYKVPAAKYARMRMSDETARALGHEPFRGGIPPYEWIGQEIAPAIGYGYGDDTFPVFEYYGYYDPEKGAHEFCYLYVPIERIGA